MKTVNLFMKITFVVCILMALGMSYGYWVFNDLTFLVFVILWAFFGAMVYLAIRELDLMQKEERII